MTAKINMIQKTFIITFLLLLVIIVSQFINYPFEKIILISDLTLLFILGILQLIQFSGMKILLIKTNDILSRGNERDFSVLRDKENNIINYKIANLIKQLEDSVEQSKIILDEKEKLLLDIKKSDERIGMIQENLNKEVISIKNKILLTVDTIDKVSHDFSSLIETQDIEEESLTSLMDVYSTYEESFSTINQSVEKSKGIAAREIHRSNQLIVSLSELYDKSENNDEQLSIIFKGIDNIREVTDIINDVAEKASILSLNAAIESAHAGEAGKGFAVVAEEVGVLASSTAEHAENINEALYTVTDMITENKQNDLEGNSAYPDLIAGVKGINDAFIRINELLDFISLLKKPLSLVKTDNKSQNRKLIIDESLNRLSAMKNQIENSFEDISRLVILPTGVSGSRELNSRIKIHETALKPVIEEQPLDL